MNAKRQFLAVALLLAACGDSPTGPGGSGNVTFLTTGAQGTPGWLLDDSLEVRIGSARSGAAAGTWVHWSSATDGAWFSADSTLTNGDGVARVAYAPGWALGTQQVVAAVGSRQATITVTVTGMTFTATEMYDNRVCGIDLDGKLWCWAEYSNELHPNTLDDARRPIPVATDKRFMALRVDPYTFQPRYGFCALTTDGEAWCAASTDFAGAKFTISAAPQLHRLDTPGPIIDLAFRNEDQCLIDVDGFAWCRGKNGSGQLGDGTRVANPTWQQVLGGQRFAELVVGVRGACAITPNGRPWCWGSNDARRLGITPESLLIPPTPVDGDLRFKRIASMGGGYCGITALGTPTLLCWGQTGFAAPRWDTPEPSSLQGIPDQTAGLGGNELGGQTVQGGHVYRFGYTGVHADERFGGQYLEPDVTGATALLSRSSYYWCASHESGSTICSKAFDRPVAVPLPM